VKVTSVNRIQHTYVLVHSNEGILYPKRNKVFNELDWMLHQRHPVLAQLVDEFLHHSANVCPTAARSNPHPVDMCG
jgi:hypothetical protein